MTATPDPSTPSVPAATDQPETDPSHQADPTSDGDEVTEEPADKLASGEFDSMERPPVPAVEQETGSEVSETELPATQNDVELAQGADSGPGADAGPTPVADSEVEPGLDAVPPLPDPVVVSADDLAGAVATVREAVRRRECVVLPTDTVYGIGADAFSPVAVQELLDAKRRGRDMPPPVLIADTFVLDTLATDVPEAARALAEAHWPGPLTLILKSHDNLRLDLGEADGTIALRVPDHAVARAVLRATGPLAVSSANVSGQDPATTVDEAVAQLQHSVAVYIDGGPTPGSVPSTIVDFTSTAAGRIVRAGALPYTALLASAPDLVDLPTPEPEPEPELPREEETQPAAELADPEAEPAEAADQVRASEIVDTQAVTGADAAVVTVMSETEAVEEAAAPALDLADLVAPPFDEALAGAPQPIPDSEATDASQASADAEISTPSPEATS